MVGTIVRAALPADDFVLGHTLHHLETVTLDIENVIAGVQECLMPLIWVGVTDRELVEAAFAADDSVSDFDLIGAFDAECLYQLEWNKQIETQIQTLVEKCMILRATGSDGVWNLRLLFTNHDDVSSTFDDCGKEGMGFEIQQIRELNEGRHGRFDLTQSQRETLTKAYEDGYYSIPREATADDLAGTLDISHQAISERLRRGHESLVKNMLFVDGSAEFSQHDPVQE
ncbi:helix-turn-helix domain-containing protein [Haladaptatus sp. NG-SE-30]